MARVLLTPQAEQDRISIWQYVSTESEAAADRLLDTLDSRLLSLADNPLAGRARNELAPNLRSHPLGRYVIFYRPIADGIQVVRVLHGARDVDLRF